MMRPHLAAWLLLAFCACGSTLLTVTPVAAESPLVTPTAGIAVPDVPEPAFSSHELTSEELLRRLEAAEQKIELLERPGESPEFVPVEAEDTFASALRERWEQVRDPSIVTVNQQTYSVEAKDKAKKWYDRLSIRGYAQFRYNWVLDEDPNGARAQYVGDRSVGDNQNFIIRRARVILSGDVSDHMYVYLQPDFASTVPNSPDNIQYTQIRDWYADLYLDTDKVFRFRVGQSKIPYGWENLQSSSNRLVLDRNDALNSAVRNERDLGVMFYWTPTEAQDLFKKVLDEGLKGSGNYGVFGLGVYNGQGGSLAEQNDNVHIVSRLAWPFELDNGQIMELGIQGYTGRYVVLSSAIEPLGVGAAVRPFGTLERGDNRGLRDQRIAGTFVYYPQPFGLQAEWTVGQGPELRDDQIRVTSQSLYGGYVMAMYRQETECWGTVIPFARWNYFNGGYKSERNAPSTLVNEWELGWEWQFNPQMELVTQYTITDRTNTTALGDGLSYRQFEGQLLRMQFQINY